MKLAILFWFYKEPEVCQNRLEILRQYNPQTPIYGLYGGDLAIADQYESALSPYLDDFYTFSEAKDSHWKWIQGDLMITQWYRDRGKDLPWDTIVIIQWDMLVFGVVEELFGMLQRDQILLSGLRPIKEVELDWLWTTPNVPEHQQRYAHFLEYMHKTYHYSKEPLACLFIVVCLPKAFLEKYSNVEQPELGFIEYRIPMYAQIFNTSFCNDHPYEGWWVDVDPIFKVKNPFMRLINAFSLRLNPNPLNPAKREISLIPIYYHLNHLKGARIFHPYEQIFPLARTQRLKALLNEFQRDIRWFIRKLLKKR